MLIALAAPKADRAITLHGEFCRTGRPVVPAPVVTQAWRGGASKAHLARALKDCAVICCYVEAEWRRVGELLGQAVLPAKTRPDPVDGLVALTATQVGAAAVATSDTADIQAYLDELPGGGSVVTVRV